jgi:hypothetical protein
MIPPLIDIPEVVKEIREERKRYMNKKMLQPQKGKEREVAVSSRVNSIPCLLYN